MRRRQFQSPRRAQPARSGDTLIVWKLDRLARSTKQLIETIEMLRSRDIGFRSLTEAIDTTTAQGVLVFHMFSALAEFERALIQPGYHRCGHCQSARRFPGYALPTSPRRPHGALLTCIEFDPDFVAGDFSFSRPIFLRKPRMPARKGYKPRVLSSTASRSNSCVRPRVARAPRGQSRPNTGASARCQKR